MQMGNRAIFVVSINPHSLMESNIFGTINSNKTHITGLF